MASTSSFSDLESNFDFPYFLDVIPRRKVSKNKFHSFREAFFS
eukprot:UN07126